MEKRGGTAPAGAAVGRLRVVVGPIGRLPHLVAGEPVGLDHLGAVRDESSWSRQRAR